MEMNPFKPCLHVIEKTLQVINPTQNTKKVNLNVTHVFKNTNLIFI